MRTAPKFDCTAVVTTALVLAVVFAGCRPKPPAAPPAPVPPPPEVTVAAPVTPSAPATQTPPSEPPLAAMTLAHTGSKLGVPVDLRYQFDGEVHTGRPVTLHLAAVPRVSGSNLQVSIKENAGARATDGELRAQKATAATAYRQQLSVTKLAEEITELRVLVTMDLPEGSAFSYFSVPFAAAKAAVKNGAVKQQ